MLNTYFRDAKFSPKNMPDVQTMAFIGAAVFFVFMPLEISHLISALIGALVYLLLQRAPTSSHRSPAFVKPRTSGRSQRPRPNASQPRPNSSTTTVDTWKPSAQPVQAPTFRSAGWDAEMDELVDQITPSSECEAVVAKIAQVAQRAVQPLFPTARVTGYVTGNLSSGKAFGVAVPEVELVMSVKPALISAWVQKKAFRGDSRIDSNQSQVQKSMIRACTDRLVNAACFKFRRSAFRDAEPKVTLLVPTTAGIFHETVPLNFSVNAPTPVHMVTLLEGCEKIEPRAKALILAVKRWAKDRGVCHVAKGNLSPYAWSVLTVSFLQQTREEGPFLPAMEETSTGPKFQHEAPLPGAQSQKSVGSLFKDFVRFYSQFDWTDGATVSLGAAETTVTKGMVIADPFEASTNLATSLTDAGLARLKQELARAEEIFESEASLQRLLEPWAPSDAEPQEAEER